MAKKGDKYGCGVCGLEVVCTEGCGCDAATLICCGKEMRNKRKTTKKPAKKKKK